MSISIIIPTLNRPNQLLDLLKRLYEITSDEDEIIIVDDSLKSQEVQIKQLFSSRVFYVNRGKKLGVSSARNVGASVSTNPYLIFLDDDDDFSSGWISDFRNSMESNPDLVFCNMEVHLPNGESSKCIAKKDEFKTVIPGAWLIRRELFEKIGGFDERLKFAENTEFFFRLNKEKIEKRFIDSFNFIYYQSADGGSQNLQNMIDSLTIILKKHDNYLNNNVKHLYNQIIGVNELRFRHFSDARVFLWKAFILKPYKFSTLGRFLISLFPFLATRVYTEKVN